MGHAVGRRHLNQRFSALFDIFISVPDEPSIDPGPWKLFLSYSWDSEEHKAWVLAFAERLRDDGIDAVLDQTHLDLGGRTPEFMERAVRESSRVLVICSDEYKLRFDGRKGGAGYEGHIITAEILSAVGRNKFIPILRQGDWGTAVPTALDRIYGVDLRTDSTGSYKDLVRHLYRINKVRPLGPPPAWLNEGNQPSAVPPTEEQAVKRLGRADKPFTGIHRDRAGGFSFVPNTHRLNPFFLGSPEVDSTLNSFKPGEVIVLYGLGGAGKTQYAVQYARAHRHEYRHVLWASANTVNGLYESLAALADSSQTPAGVDPHAPTVEKVNALFEWLATELEAWLLIIDNADFEEAAREIERLLPPGHVGNVIITSRLTQWTLAFRTQPVNAWDEAQASAFLLKRLALATAPEELAKLGRALGGLPLALEQAAAYIQQTRTPVGHYLRLLSTDQEAMLARHHPGTTEYPASVATTWLVTIKRLKPLARYILSLVACFSSEPLSRDILHHLRDGHAIDPADKGPPKTSSPDPINLALGELAAYSLIVISEDSLRMHPMLQAVVRHSHRRLPWHFRLWRGLMVLPDRKTWARVSWPLRAAGILSADGVLPWSGSGDVGIFEMRQYVPHIDAVLSHLPAEVDRFTPVPRLKWIAEHYRRQISTYESGVTFLRSRLAATASRFPQLKAETDWFLAALEDLYRHAVSGKRGDRLGQKLRSLPDEAGAEPWTVYEVLREWARGIVARGDSTTARRIYRLCWDHATTDGDASFIDRARTRISEALYLTAETPDEELTSLLEEGLGLYEQHSRLTDGDAIEAICLYISKVQTVEQKHRALAWLRQVMPRIYEMMPYGWDVGFHAAGQYLDLLLEFNSADEALRESERMLRATARPEKWAARGHRSIIWDHRGDLLAQDGRHLSAARCYSHAIALRRTYLSPAPLIDARLLYRRGIAYLNAGRQAPAISSLTSAAEKLIEKWQDIPEHAENIAALVGVYLGRSDQLAAGETLLRRALGSRRERLGGDAPGLANIHRLFGIFLHDAGRLREAETELRRALVLAHSEMVAGNLQKEELLQYFSGLNAVLSDLKSEEPTMQADS